MGFPSLGTLVKSLRGKDVVGLGRQPTPRPLLHKDNFGEGEGQRKGRAGEIVTKFVVEPWTSSSQQLRGNSCPDSYSNSKNNLGVGWGGKHYLNRNQQMVRPHLHREATSRDHALHTSRVGKKAAQVRSRH